MSGAPPIEPATVTFVQVAVPPASARQGVTQVWDFYTPGAPQPWAFARAEIFPGREQWGVRLQDRAPELSQHDLMRLVAKLLVWNAGCSSETVEVVLGRTHEHVMLVRVAGDYV